VPADLAAIASQLRARRRELGLTQEVLAQLAGCSTRFVGAVESGKPTVRLDKLLPLLEALGLRLQLARRGTT